LKKKYVNSKIDTLKKELNAMIQEGKPYGEILKKSQQLDEFITVEFQRMNKKYLEKRVVNLLLINFHKDKDYRHQ